MIPRTKAMAAVLTGILAALCSCVSLGSQSESTLHPSFAMQQGTFWVYRGTVRWYDMQLQKRVSSVVTSKCEVVRTMHGDGFVAALMRGFPWDFDWSDGQADRHDWLVVETSAGDFHVLNNEALAKNLKRLENPSDSLQGILSDDDLFLRLPIKKGMKFCDPESRKRPDGRYCWVVASTHETPLNNVKGIKPGKYTSFLLQYVTNPDDTEMEFVPGLGFIAYRYHHHGSVADTEMELVEYHAAKDTQAMPGEMR